MIPGFPSHHGLKTPPLLVPRRLNMKNIFIVVKTNALRYKLLCHLKFREMELNERVVLNIVCEDWPFKTIKSLKTHSSVVKAACGSHYALCLSDLS
jgi:hypothetical protein